MALSAPSPAQPKGATGVLVQIVTLALLLRVSGMHYLAATALAVGLTTRWLTENR